MNTPPHAVVEYLKTVFYPELAFAYLQLDDHHHVVASGGEMGKCGIPIPEKNISIENQIDQLSGVLPVTGAPVVILNTQLVHKTFIDMHIFIHQGSQWVLFFNNTEAGIKLQAEQQTRLVNDIVREKKEKTGT